MCDFGADHAFGQVENKLKEHYGIELASSASRVITERHATEISERKDLKKVAPFNVEQVIAECDGCMVPIVETFVPEDTASSKDRRKNKTTFWKEARLSLARADNSKSPCFAGTMGTVQMAGAQLVDCVRQVGAYSETRIHAVGDRAAWIALQIEEQFGSKGTYLIDFFFFFEYLSAAAESCAGTHPEPWLTLQKKRMKQNEYHEVLRAFQPYREAHDVEDEHAPVRACYRYINNRPEQLDYKSAIEKNLPIGSGEVESAHRYVIQKRLKIAGAWWKASNAEHMLNLRTCRANGLWNEYWKKTA